jgi:hypothetical protein
LKLPGVKPAIRSRVRKRLLITEGDIVKTLILDKLLPIISGEGGRGLVLIFIIPRQPAIR